MQQQSSSQRVGALLIHRPAWVDQHTGGSRLTPTVHRCPKGMAVGSTVQKHPKHGSGAMSIQGKSFKTIHEDQCRNVDDCRVHKNGPRGTCVDSVQCEMSDFQTDIDGGQECENPDDCGGCMVSRAETRSDAAN